MAGFFSSLASKGLLGGGIGAYAANKKFRGGVNKFLFGEGPQQMPTLNPEQLQGLSKLINGLEQNPLYQSGQNYLQGLLGNEPGAFSQFTAPYIQQFNQQTAPGIAERFAGMGTGAGAGSSSGLNNALAQAASTLQTNLASQREGLRMQALPQALGYSQQPFSNISSALNVSPFAYTQGGGGALEGLLKALGSFTSGPAGMAGGQASGAGLSSLFRSSPGF